MYFIQSIGNVMSKSLYVTHQEQIRKLFCFEKIKIKEKQKSTNRFLSTRCLSREPSQQQ